MKTICFASLGCHKNLVDTELILGALDGAGFEIDNNPETADVIFVNTCGFLHAAREESAATIREMNVLRKPDSVLVVTGCMADRDRGWLLDNASPVDLFLSSFNLDAIPALLKRRQSTKQFMDYDSFRWAESPRWLSTPESYGYAKISDGCDNRCNYCRIPYLRGPFRSRSMEDILQEVSEIVETGRQEIVLISQDSSSWGRKSGSDQTFTDLVDRVSRINNLRRLRLMYLYPSQLDRQLLELIKDRDNICNYLDLPLQHVSLVMLQKMNRRLPSFRCEPSMKALEFFKEIRSVIPDIRLRTTLMTGFYGETEEEFNELLEFVESGIVDHLGVFSWSPEPNTPAADKGWKTADPEADSRTAILMEAQMEIMEQKNIQLLGESREVLIDELVDEEGEYDAIGRLEFQAPEVDGVVRVRGRCHPGEYCNVRITSVDLCDFEGEITSVGMKSADSSD